MHFMSCICDVLQVVLNTFTTAVDSLKYCYVFYFEKRKMGFSCVASSLENQALFSRK